MMTTNTDTHVYKLRFMMDKNAPASFKKRWVELKQECESGELNHGNKHIVEKIKGFCQLPQNKELPYLKRSEGGLGGDDNHTNKQIRFREAFLQGWISISGPPDDDIVMLQLSNTEFEKWTYDELDDLIQAFIHMAENELHCEDCLIGWIEMTPKGIYRY